ncbi:hypothetical protein [Brucella cytisi]|uniref:hypothetical protein n=1 Tax=Brucella cytisi TaxID=407152 RepID=UPI00142E6669|nr:hypothetical protein [Brucella cytisi]
MVTSNLILLVVSLIVLFIGYPILRNERVTVIGIGMLIGVALGYVLSLFFA